MISVQWDIIVPMEQPTQHLVQSEHSPSIYKYHKKVTVNHAQEENTVMWMLTPKTHLHQIVLRGMYAKVFSPPLKKNDLKIIKTNKK